MSDNGDELRVSNNLVYITASTNLESVSSAVENAVLQIRELVDDVSRERTERRGPFTVSYLYRNEDRWRTVEIQRESDPYERIRVEFDPQEGHMQAHVVDELYDRIDIRRPEEGTFEYEAEQQELRVPGAGGPAPDEVPEFGLTPEWWRYNSIFKRRLRANPQGSSYVTWKARDRRLAGISDDETDAMSFNGFTHNGFEFDDHYVEEWPATVEKNGRVPLGGRFDRYTDGLAQWFMRPGQEAEAHWQAFDEQISRMFNGKYGINGAKEFLDKWLVFKAPLSGSNKYQAFQTTVPLEEAEWFNSHDPGRPFEQTMERGEAPRGIVMSIDPIRSHEPFAERELLELPVTVSRAEGSPHMLVYVPNADAKRLNLSEDTVVQIAMTIPSMLE